MLFVSELFAVHEKISVAQGVRKKFEGVQRYEAEVKEQARF